MNNICKASLKRFNWRPFLLQLTWPLPFLSCRHLEACPPMLWKKKAIKSNVMNHFMGSTKTTACWHWVHPCAAMTTINCSSQWTGWTLARSAFVPDVSSDPWRFYCRFIKRFWFVEAGNSLFSKNGHWWGQLEVFWFYSSELNT